VTERVEVEVPSRLGASIQPAAYSAYEKVEVRQPGSPSVLMLAFRVAEPSLTTGVLSGNASVTEVSLVQVSSSSFEEHGDYSGEEVDFDDDPALPDISNFLHILRKRCRWMFLQWFRHRERSPLPRIFLLSLLIITPLS